MTLKTFLELRVRYLKDLNKKYTSSVASAPHGSLQTETRHGHPVYFHCAADDANANAASHAADADGSEKATKKKNRRYIKKDERELAVRLAQKDYEKKVLAAARRELKAIQKCLDLCPSIAAEAVWPHLSEARRNMVTPFLYPDDMFKKMWEAEAYESKDISACDSEIYTLKGEHVRSKSEKIIADTLFTRGIPYRYEAALYLKGYGLVHPDFTALDIRLQKEKYIEHLGLMDDPDYAEEALQRINAYEQNGYYLGETLFITFETGKAPLNTKLLEQRIDHIFGRRISPDLSNS